MGELALAHCFQTPFIYLMHWAFQMIGCVWDAASRLALQHQCLFMSRAEDSLVVFEAFNRSCSATT